MSLRTAVSSSTGTFDTIAAAAQISGTAVFMGGAYAKVKGLSAKITALAETNTITLSFKWQVSVDNSTWLDVANGSQNASAVVLGTGTAGADTAVTKVFAAPEAVYGYKWARWAIVVGVTTGAVGDTYAGSYSYRQLTGAEGSV